MTRLPLRALLFLVPIAALAVGSRPAPAARLTTLSLERRHLASGAAPGDRFGAAVAAAGDVDADGAMDLLVGAPHADVGGADAGSVSVLSGLDGALLLVAHGDDPYDRLGFALGGAGDVDGDGHDDVVVGAPTGTPAAGSVRLLSGRDGSVLRAWTGGAPGARFGAAVAGAGDVDADGTPDLVVGAPHDAAAGPYAGYVAVYSGRDGALLLDRSGAPFDQLGAAVAAAGDVDGDGHADVLVGAPLADAAGFNTGSALVLSGADASVLLAFHGEHPGDRLGSTVAAAGDVDADGTDDLLLGVPAADAGGVDAGAIQVRSGRGGGLVLLVTGSFPGAYLQSAASLGDVDGDGHADLLVGSPAASACAPQSGRVRVVSGATGRDLALADGALRGDWFGASLAGLGDVDGDGRVELLVGAPGHDDDPSKTGSASVYSLQP